jgi:hypothetical protein
MLWLTSRLFIWFKAFVSQPCSEATVTFKDPAVAKAVALSTPDGRFMDSVIQTVLQAVCLSSLSVSVICCQASTGEPEAFSGSSDWVRQQFGVYLTALLATTREYEATLDAKVLERLSGLRVSLCGCPRSDEQSFRPSSTSSGASTLRTTAHGTSGRSTAESARHGGSSREPSTRTQAD